MESSVIQSHQPNHFVHNTDPGRDAALQLVCKQHKTRSKVLEAYSKVKQALKTMGDEYVTSKETRNLFVRYRLLRQMVKQVIILERQYWTLVDVPKQEVKSIAGRLCQQACGFISEAIYLFTDSCRIWNNELKAIKARHLVTRACTDSLAVLQPWPTRQKKRRHSNHSKVHIGSMTSEQ